MATPIERALMKKGQTVTQLYNVQMGRATVTIAPYDWCTVITIENRDPRPDGVYEGIAIAITEDCHINDCRQDAEELGINFNEAWRLAHMPDTSK